MATAVRSGILAFFAQLLSRPTSADSKTDNDPPSSTPTEPVGAPVAGPDLPHGTDDPQGSSYALRGDSDLSPSAPRIALIEQLRDTGDLKEQLYAEYELTTREHLQRFSSLLGRVHDEQRKREAHVNSECEATWRANDAATAQRKKEALELRAALERKDECERARLNGRVLQQCTQHNHLAHRGFSECIRFAENVLATEIAIGRNVLLRVRSLVPSGKRDEAAEFGKPDSTPAPLSIRVQESLDCIPNHTWVPLSFTWQQGPNEDMPIGDINHRQWLRLCRKYVTAPSTPPALLHLGPGEGCPVQYPAPGGRPTDVELLASFENHFLAVERNCERQWRSLQDEHTADIGVWRERFQKLLASLAEEFTCDGARVGPGNVVHAADEADRASARNTFDYCETHRGEDLQRLWAQTARAFGLHHEAFVECLRTAECGLASDEYSAQVLGPIPSPRFPPWMDVDRIEIRVGGFGPRRPVTASPAPFTPPFSPASILAARGAARVLPTTSPRVRLRARFRDAQAARARRFEATLAAFEAEAEDARRRLAATLAAELLRWRAQAAEAERERAAQFARGVEAAREEWAGYRRRRARDADRLVHEIEGHFSRAQAAREEHFKSGVQRVHDDFMRVVRDLA